jgi:FkbM family methyltransferase
VSNEQPRLILSDLRIPHLPGVRLLTRDDDHVVGGVIRHDGLWEPIETALAVHGIGVGDTVADVGAHVGYFSIVASRLVGPSGHVFAFEPEAANFELLKANCILNGCQNVRVQRCALADHNGVANLALSSTNSGDHRLGTAETRGSQLVEVRCFDDWRASEIQVDFLKIDVQGCEVAVLKGMVNTIGRSTDKLAAIVEMSPVLSERVSYAFSNLNDILWQLTGLPHLFQVECDTLTIQPLNSEMLAQCWNDLAQAGRDDAGKNLLLFFSTEARDRFVRRLSDRLGSRLRIKGVRG